MAEPHPEYVLDKMMTALKPVIPPQLSGVPAPSLTMAKAALRPAAIGNHVGLSPRGSIAAVDWHAVRVEALARFSLWGAEADLVDAEVPKLTKNISDNRKALANGGFLKLSFSGSSPAEQAADGSKWRRFVDYDLLYEHAYEDDDGALGLILPIVSLDTSTAAKWSTTADSGRWDDNAAPLFSLRGPGVFTKLAALRFIAANPPTGTVKITRTFDGALAPSDAGTLAAFLAQATNAVPERNIFVSFASVSDLLAAFKSDGPPVAIGDPSEADNKFAGDYFPLRLDFPAPLVLAGVADRLELTYAGPKLDQTAVVYLRAIRKEAST